MKVIKPEIDIDTWVQEEACPFCHSIIGIECKDVYYEYTQSNGTWMVTCCLCNEIIRFHDEDLPKIVRADAWKHRKIMHYSDD